MKTWKIMTEENQSYPMGLTMEGGRVHLSVAAACDTCSLLLYRKGEEAPFEKIPMRPEDRMGDVWNLTLEGLETGDLEYGFETDGRPVPDSFGRSFSGRESWAKPEEVHKTLRTPFAEDFFDWEDDRPLELPYEDTIIYRIHTRGLTKHSSSKVADKGTFQAIMAKIPYMKDLGITTVELLPVTEFQEVMMPEHVDGNPYGVEKPTGKINYWGYTRTCYFAPKAAYSAGREKHPVREFKALVKAFHQAGLEVVTELYFDGSQTPSFVLEVIRFWVREYHVDGIHLIGAVPLKLVGDDPYLSRTKLFATSWEGVAGGKRKHLAEYNDGFLIDMRRLLKGDEDQINQLIFRSKQNPAPCGIINYMANTNGFTMMDMVSYDQKHNEANGEGNQDGSIYNYSWNCGVEGHTRKKKIVELRKKQIRNAMLMLFLSQGTPLLLSGDEFGNSKSGNNNSYCQDNEISWLNWNQLKSNRDIYEFTKYIIGFRKAHPVFHMKAEPKVMDYRACGYPDVSYHGVNAWCPEFDHFRRQLGILYHGAYAKKADGSADDSFFVAYNMHWEPHEFALPNLPKTMNWYVALNTDAQEVNGIYQPGEEPVLENRKQFSVPARTIIVFIGK